jgi:microcystin-dependent protein
MSEPFIAEIRVFAFNFAPRGWAHCQGQLIAIAQNTALFSILGTTYGGNGQTSFALPNLQGRAVMHAGQGPGLSNYALGQTGGTTTVTLTADQMPTHNHSMATINGPGTASNPASNTTLAVGAKGAPLYAPVSGATGTMHASTALPTGRNQPHNNMQPYLTLNFAIAMLGIFPSRN